VKQLSEPIKINIDYHRLSSILGILTAVSAGDSSPLFIEERTRELQECIPFLPTAVSLMAEAMDRLSQVKQKDIEHDTEALREFFVHQDMVCRAQGVIAALLCVGESLRTDASREKEQVQSPTKTKGKRSVRKTKKGQADKL
jgi:hypothetical protein